MEPITFKVKKCQTPSDFSASFSLQLVGSLPVHSLTTMSMLPWIVAEIQLLSAKSSKEEPSASQIRLCVSPANLRCEPDTGETQQWDPLICSSLFEYKPQQVHKLIHNSHDPSYFACLIKDEAANQQSICYVFKADDQTKVLRNGAGFNYIACRELMKATYRSDSYRGSLETGWIGYALLCFSYSRYWSG